MNLVTTEGEVIPAEVQGIRHDVIATGLQFNGHLMVKGCRDRLEVLPPGGDVGAGRNSGHLLHECREFKDTRLRNVDVAKIVVSQCAHGHAVAGILRHADSELGAIDNLLVVAVHDERILRIVHIFESHFVASRSWHQWP